MYASRVNRYGGYGCPSIDIRTPVKHARVPYKGFDAYVSTRAARLGYQRYHFQVYLNDELYDKNGENFYRDGTVRIDGPLDNGKLNFKVKLFNCDTLVDEDCVELVVTGCPAPEKKACNPIDSYSLTTTSCMSDDEDEVKEPCHSVSSSSCEESDDEDEVKEPCHSVTTSSSSSSCEESDDEDEPVTRPCDPQCLVGDGGLVKEVHSAGELEDGIRTFIVTETCDNNMILTLPAPNVGFGGPCDTTEGRSVTVVNDSGVSVLLEAPVGFHLKGVDGYFLLGLNQSATFHNNINTWYVVSK